MDCSVSQLLQAALGHNELGPINFQILHEVIDLILQQLGCENEIVTFTGLEAERIRKALQESSGCSLSTQRDNTEQCMSSISKSIQQIREVEEKVEEVDQKLQGHLNMIEMIQNVNIPPLRVSPDFVQDFVDRCSVSFASDDMQDIVCTLTKSKPFLRKMQRRLTMPFVNEIFQLEDQVAQLYDQITEFIENAQNDYKQTALVDRCHEEARELKDIVEHRHARFLGCMEEVQEMLDGKVDKIHTQALKNLFKKEFNNMRKYVKNFREKKSCQAVHGTLKDGIMCLTCCNKVCTNVLAESTGTAVPNWKAPKSLQAAGIKRNEHKKKEEDHTDCPCFESPLQPNQSAIENSSIKFAHKEKTITPIHLRQSKNPCLVIDRNVDLKFVTGTDKKAYRKG